MHSLLCTSANLALEKSCSSIKSVRYAIGTVGAINNFKESSAKRHNVFKNAQDQMRAENEQPIIYKSLKRLCETRLSSRDKSFSSIKQNFGILFATLKVSKFTVKKNRRI